MPRPSLHCFLFVVSSLLLTACTTPAERRDAIRATHESWNSEVLPEEQSELLENLRALGNSGREPDDWLVSLTLVSRLALRNPSGLVRAESLLTAWRLAADLPAEVIPSSGLASDALRQRIRRFEALDDARNPAEQEEWLTLANALAAYRFPPSSDPRERDLPIELCEMLVARAYAAEDDLLLRTIESDTAGSARHSLSLITIYAGDDVDPAVREAALRVARHIDPLAALNLITGALTVEDDTQVVLAAIDSLAALSDQLSRRKLLATLSRIGPGSDLALRRAADSLAQDIGQ